MIILIIYTCSTFPCQHVGVVRYHASLYIALYLQYISALYGLLCLFFFNVKFWCSLLLLLTYSIYFNLYTEHSLLSSFLYELSGNPWKMKIFLHSNCHNSIYPDFVHSLIYFYIKTFTCFKGLWFSCSYNNQPLNVIIRWFWFRKNICSVQSLKEIPC